MAMCKWRSKVSMVMHIIYLSLFFHWTTKPDVMYFTASAWQTTTTFQVDFQAHGQP